MKKFLSLFLAVMIFAGCFHVNAYAEETIYPKVIHSYTATENFAGARHAGLPIGVYFYSQAISVEEARQEAAFVLDTLKGRRLEFPVVFDWEDYYKNSRTANMDPETLNALAIAFCEEIAKAGYEPMIYFSPDLDNRLWDLELMQQQGYSFWLAMYRDTMNWPYEAQMWQYTQTGRVNGIDGDVDINLYFP